MSLMKRATQWFDRWAASLSPVVEDPEPATPMESIARRLKLLQSIEFLELDEIVRHPVSYSLAYPTAHDLVEVLAAAIDRLQSSTDFITVRKIQSLVSPEDYLCHPDTGDVPPAHYVQQFSLLHKRFVGVLALPHNQERVGFCNRRLTPLFQEWENALALLTDLRTADTLV